MERATEMSSPHGPLRIGIGGPVGSGKTALMDLLCKAMRERYDIAAITNDIYTKWDAECLVRAGWLTPDRSAGVETGGCPHTAIREDASMNLAAVADMRAKFPNLDLVLIESGGDNLAATFSPELADLTIYVIDVAAGDKIPAKGGPGSNRPESRRGLLAGTGRSHDLCHRRRGGRQDPVEGRAWHHPVGSPGHQQDRPRAARRRLAGKNGPRCTADARRAAVRHDQFKKERGVGAHHQLHRNQGRPRPNGAKQAWLRESVNMLVAGKPRSCCTRNYRTINRNNTACLRLSLFGFSRDRARGGHIKLRDQV